MKFNLKCVYTEKWNFFNYMFSIFVDACCKRVVVVSSGAAKEDQSLYLGTYRVIANYNGHAAYELEGADQLYIYFYSSVVSRFFKLFGVLWRIRSQFSLK